MNSRKPRFYSPIVAIILASLTGCVAGERRTVHIARTWDASAIKRIELREVDGEVRIDAAAPNTITLDATVHSWRKRPDPDKDNQGFFVTSVEGDTLVIGRRQRVHFSFFNSDRLSIDYELKVPPQLALDLRTVNGRIVSRGVDGETDVTTVNGSIDIETPGSNELSAHTINGRIETKFGKDFRGASLKTVNGRVTATLPTSASFVGDFSQVNGDFEAAFPLNIHSHPGNRRVTGEVNGGQHELKITTVNGDIQLNKGAGTIPLAPAAPTAPAAPASVPTAPTPPSPPPSPTT
jgi:hypothetical protein